jgi:hypothetical protein
VRARKAESAAPLGAAGLRDLRERVPRESRGLDDVLDLTTRTKDAAAARSELHRMVEDHCLDCHGSKANHDFTADVLPPHVLARMAMAVGAGEMPKDAPLPRDERRRFIALYARAVGLDGQDVARAAEVLVDHRRASRAPILDLTMQSLGEPSSTWDPAFMERFVGPANATRTPGVSAIVGVAAVRACKKEGAPLEKCLSAKLRDPMFGQGE